MKYLLLSLFLSLFSSLLSAETAIIVNLQNPTHKISVRDVQEIYMGRKHVFADNSFAYPIDYSVLRNDFYKKIANRPIEQINAYWARLMFSGRNSPPIILSNAPKIIQQVIDNKNAIAYIDEEDVDENAVRIILLLN